VEVAALSLKMTRKAADSGQGEVDYAERLLDSPYPQLREIPSAIHYADLGLKKSAIHSDLRFRCFLAPA